MRAVYFYLHHTNYKFYRSFLIAPTKCHPEVGAIYGSTCYLDFYIDGDIQLGFELLRNGVKINGHLDRFDAENGIYKDIPHDDYAVLDFYQVDTFDGNHFNGNKYIMLLFFQLILARFNFGIMEMRYIFVVEHFNKSVDTSLSLLKWVDHEPNFVKS
jgi:hypothetical protein